MINNDIITKRPRGRPRVLTPEQFRQNAINRCSEYNKKRYNTDEEFKQRMKEHAKNMYNKSKRKQFEKTF